MARDPRLSGFLWQGRQYEGLNCNVFEAIWGHGGELLRDGRIALDTDAARAALRWMRETIETGLSPRSTPVRSHRRPRSRIPATARSTGRRSRTRAIPIRMDRRPSGT